MFKTIWDSIYDKITGKDIEQIRSERMSRILDDMAWGDIACSGIVPQGFYMSGSGCSGTSATGSMTDELLRIKKLVDDIPKPKFDILILTDKQFQQLKQQFVELKECDTGRPFGLDIEVVANETTAIWRAIEIALNSKRRVAIMRENGDVEVRSGQPVYNEVQSNCTWRELFGGV